MFSEGGYSMDSRKTMVDVRFLCVCPLIDDKLWLVDLQQTLAML